MANIVLGLMFVWIIFSAYCGIEYSRTKNGSGKKFFYGLGAFALVLFSAFLYQILFLVLFMAYFFGSWNIIHEFVGFIGMISLFVIAFTLPINLLSIGALKYKGLLEVFSNIVY